MTLQMQPACRYSEVRPQAEFAAIRIGEDIGARTQALADDIEEDIRRLDDRGRNGLIARLGEDGHQTLRLSLQLLELPCGFCGHPCAHLCLHRSGWQRT